MRLAMYLNLAIVLNVAAFTSPLYAVNSRCAPSYQSHSSYVAHDYVAPYVQPQTIIENQNVFYSVASDIRQYAITPPAVAVAQYGQLQRQIARLADQMNEARELAAYTPQPQVVYVPVQAQPVQAAPCATGTCPPKMPPATQPPAQPQQPAPEHPTFSMTAPSSIIQTKCIECHGGKGKPKGDLDLRSQITCDQFEHAIERLLTDDVSQRMPQKADPLTGEETAAVQKELLALRKQPK